MKNKFLALLCALMINICASYAATQIKVSAEGEFNTENPTNSIKVEIREDVVLGEYNLKAGDTLNCEVVKVTDPQRGKQSASFFVVPKSYISNGEAFTINDSYYGKYSKTVLSVEELKKIPPYKVIGKTALTVGNHFVKGLSTGVYFAEGVVQSGGEKPIRSGVKKAYKESPLSYVEKGSELDIKPGDEFYLIFKISDDAKEKPNYEFNESAK